MRRNRHIARGDGQVNDRIKTMETKRERKKTTGDKKSTGYVQDIRSRDTRIAGAI